MSESRVPPLELQPGATLDEPYLGFAPAIDSESTSSGSPFSDVLKGALRHCQKLVDAKVVRIWVSRRGGERLVSREFDASGADYRERRMARGEGLAGWVIANGEPLRLRAGGPRPDLTGPVPPFRSALVAPLFRRGAAFGAIECLDPRHSGDFSDADLERFVVAAEPIAMAIDNALLVEQAERRALEKEVLLEISRTLSAPLELDEVIEAIFRSLRQVVDYDAAAIYLMSKGTQALELVREVGYPAGSEDAFRLQVGQGVVGWVAKTGQATIVPDVARDSRYVVARVETRSEVAAPLVVEGRTIGVFNLESDLEDAYHEGHLDIVKGFAAQAAVAVERARLTRELVDQRRLERELAIAHDIQRSFLPEAPPQIPGFDLAGTTESHGVVGGDYYDFIRVSDTRLGLAIADVSGKGIPAALIMAGFRMSLLAEIRNEFAIRAIMRKVNTLVHESTDHDKFVTACYGLLDTRNRVIIFSNAGHNPPILWRRDGPVEYLDEGGVALGVLPDAHYEDQPVALRTGDILVMFTDGVTEAEAPNLEHFGSGRVEACVERLADRSAAEILDGIVRSVLEWTGDRGPSDDLTLLVLKVTEPD